MALALADYFPLLLPRISPAGNSGKKKISFGHVRVAMMKLSVWGGVLCVFQLKTTTTKKDKNVDECLRWKRKVPVTRAMDGD